MGINLEIKHTIAWVYKAIDARRKLEKAPPPPVKAKVVRAEENICIQSRALFSKFVDTTLWRDGIDPEAAEAVREALTVAKDSISVDTQCKDSLNARLAKFSEFCSSRSALSAL